MLILGLDFETTGLDLKNDRITEVGAVLWDTDTKAPVRVLSEFVHCDPYPLITPEITRLTGITQNLLNTHGIHPKAMLSLLGMMANSASYVVAHNGTEFDKPMLFAELNRQGFDHILTPWIDTQMDLPYPDSITTRKLTHLAAEHGFVNPFAHRALFDVLTMLKIISCYDINTVVKYASSPTLKIRADVHFGTKEKAKARGFRWDGENKWWVKNIKEFQLDAELKDAPFKIIVMKGK